MNNLIVITHKRTGEQKLFTGGLLLKSNDRVFGVRQMIGVASVLVARFDRKLYFADIEDLDDEDLL